MKSVSTSLLFATLHLYGCGAPTKPASAVSSIFASSTSLQGIQTPLCQQLAERNEAPSTKDLVMQIGDCKMAGEGAQNLSQVTTTFKFVNIDGSAIDPAKPPGEVSDLRSSNPEDPKVIKRAYRAQVWLNRSLFDLAGIFSEFVKKSKDVTAGEVKIPDGPLDKIKNLAVNKMFISKPPVVDIANLAVDASLELQMSGAVKLYQQIDISGRLITNSVVLVAKSTNPVPYEKSIVHSSETVILVTPYAGDTYIDTFITLNMYDFGLKAIVDDQVFSILGTVLKSVMDSLLVAKEGA